MKSPSSECLYYPKRWALGLDVRHYSLSSWCVSGVGFVMNRVA